MPITHSPTRGRTPSSDLTSTSGAATEGTSKSTTTGTSKTTEKSAASQQTRYETRSRGTAPPSASPAPQSAPATVAQQTYEVTGRPHQASRALESAPQAAAPSPHLQATAHHELQQAPQPAVARHLAAHAAQAHPPTLPASLPADDAGPSRATQQPISIASQSPLYAGGRHEPQRPDEAPRGNAAASAPPSARARSRVSSTTSSRSRRIQLAKAREELAAAKLARIEAECTSEEDDEDENVSNTTRIDTGQQVERWLDGHHSVPAIDSHPHITTIHTQVLSQSAGAPRPPPPPHPEQLMLPAAPAAQPPATPPAPLQTAPHYPAPAYPAAAYPPNPAPAYPAHPARPAPYEDFAVQPYAPNNDITKITEAIRAAIVASKQDPQTRKPAELPIFTGSRRQWLSFKKVYEDTAPYFTTGENTARLQTATRNLKNTAISEFVISGARPELIMEKLEECFGNTATLAALEYRNLRDLPKLTDNAQEICSFSLKLGTIMTTLQLVDPHSSRYNSEILRALHDKLTVNLQSKWYTYSADKDRRESDVMLMVEFMKSEAKLREPYTILDDTPPAA